MSQKIKLVLSDLHLGTGRTLEGGSVNPFEEFYFDEKFVEFLDYYSKGKFAEHEVELILNGNILNSLQVDYKGHYLTVITESVSLAKVKKIVEGHPQFFSALKHFAAKEGNSLTYIVGNHDQDILWPAVRNYLNEITETEIRFKNIVHFFDGIHVEHGHLHEVANQIDPRRFFIKKNLPEPILNLPFGSHFFIDFVLKIKKRYPYVDKIRPFSRMIRWSLLNEFWFTLTGLWRLVKYFVKSLMFPDKKKGLSLLRVARLAFNRAIFPDLSAAAKKILQDEHVHTVIFGHTKVYQYRQFKEKEYFNSGSWTEITSLDMSSLGKITKMTYVLIDYETESERPRCQLKEWRGYHRIEEDVVVS